jgi:putative transcriptional regulator
MLIAMPTMMDDRFSRSVIYVCAHSSEGAMGIVVNHPAPNIKFADLLVKLDVIPAADVIQLPSRAGVVKVMRGGPVESERGFVLHSGDYFIQNSTLPINEGVCRHTKGDRAWRRPGECDLGAGLCRLGAGPIGK